MHKESQKWTTVGFGSQAGAQHCLAGVNCGQNAVYQTLCHTVLCTNHRTVSKGVGSTTLKRSS